MSKYDLVEEPGGKLRVKYRANGRLGGYVGRRWNLADYGGAVVLDNASAVGMSRVFNEAVVCENAHVRDYSKVADHAVICGNGRVQDYSWVIGKAYVGGNSSVEDYSIISETARLCGNAVVSGNSHIGGIVLVDGDVHIRDCTFTGSEWVLRRGRLTRQEHYQEKELPLLGLCRAWRWADKQGVNWQVLVGEKLTDRRVLGSYPESVFPSVDEQVQARVLYKMVRDWEKKYE